MMEIDAAAYSEFYRHLSPYLSEKAEEIKLRNTKFAHYTSAYAALQIIEKKSVWLRNTVLMNDFSEVQHGQDCLRAAWHIPHVGGRLRTLLDRIRSGLADELARSFDSRFYDRTSQTYMVSISEHGGGIIDEDKYGRLSMWRAYGGNTNVAFVFNHSPFLTESNALNAFTSPVLYCDLNRFSAEFARVVDIMERNFDMAKSIGPDGVRMILENVFHFSTISAKHPGFSEEREWRIIYSPTMWSSDKINSSIEVIDGVPQKIYKIPLKNYPDEGLNGVEIPELLSEIIIGPTGNSAPIFDALVEKLAEAGVEKPWEKVRRSNIPLRR